MAGQAAQNSVKKQFKTHLLFIVLLVAYFFSYFFRIATSVVLPQLAAEWEIGGLTIGIISSLFFYTYGLGAPLGGVLNDRYGPLRVVATGCIIAGVGSLLTTIASPLIFSIGRVLTGLGMAPVLSGILVYQSSAYGREKYTMLSSITYTVGYMGSVASVAPLSAAADVFGRVPTFAFLSIVVLLVGVVLLFFRSMDPVEISGTGKPLRDIGRQLSTSLGIIFRTTQLKAMLILWAVSFGALMAFQGLWAPTWYQTVFQPSGGQAKWWATMIGVGVAFGSLIGSSFCKGPAGRKRVLVTSSVCYALLYVSLTAVMILRISLVVAGIIGFGIGFVAGVQYLHLTAGVNDLAPAGKNGTFFGAMNLFVFASVVIFQSVSGVILENFQIAGGTGYTAYGFNLTFAIITAIIVLSLLALLFLKSFETIQKV